MLKLGVSQAQNQFTHILNQLVLIVDKKAHKKKAVIIPYEEYEKLLDRATRNSDESQKSSFSQFVGILDKNFQTDDTIYNEIVK